MIVAVHQSHYLPWTGYLDKIDTADVFVLLDTVQYEKNGWQNRNRIRTADGWMWLTVPVRRAIDTVISEVSIAADGKWQRKHQSSLMTNYNGTPGAARHMPVFREWYQQDWTHLATLNRVMLDYFVTTLGIDTRIVCSSELGVLPDTPNERLVEIVRRVQGDIYLAGSGCGEYFQGEPFDDAGIGVVFQDYRPQSYLQRFDGFISGLSVVDVLCNADGAALDIIRSGRRTIV